MKPRVQNSGGVKTTTGLTMVSSQSNSDGEIKDPLALRRMDWYAAILLCIVVIVSPLIAGDFSTPGLVSADSISMIFNAIGTPFCLLLIGIAFLPFALREISRPVTIGDVPGLLLSTVLLAAWCGLSFIHTRALYLSVTAFATLIGALLSAGIISRLARDTKALTAFVVSFITGGTLTAAIAVKEYVDYARQNVAEHRSFATFSDPNFLAGYLLLTLPVTMAVFAGARNRYIRLLAALGIIVQSAGLWLSGSRAASGIVFAAILVLVAIALYARVPKGQLKGLCAAIALFAVGTIPALAPIVARLRPHHAATVKSSAGAASTDAQVNSNEFRKWTWIGTTRMAVHNPVLGTGIGAFDVSYPRYAETAYTSHAHNSYLQIMAETGDPGLLFVLAALAAVTAFAAVVLALSRTRAIEIETERVSDSTPDSVLRLDSAKDIAAARSPELLLAGLLAAIVGSMLHSLLDSDWYVVATLIALTTVLAIVVALARDMAPLSVRRPRAMGPQIVGVGVILALFVLVRAGSLLSSRMNIAMGKTDLEIAEAKQNTAPEESRTNMALAQEAFRAAAAADPLDPEPHLDLASADAIDDDRLKELQSAVSTCPTGKTYYKLGQYYAKVQKWDDAVSAFEHARQLEPKMLQSLHALYNALLASSRVPEAQQVMLSIVALQRTPYGQVRAMHESVETEFAFAHAGLADLSAKSNPQDAVSEYAQAASVLQEYWTGRNWLVNVSGRSVEKRKELADLYERVLQQMQDLDTKLDRPADATEASNRLAEVRKNRAEDSAKVAQATVSGGQN